MKIESVRLIKGLNIYSHYPVVVIRLDLEQYSFKNTKDIGQDFIENLLEVLPGLRNHKCSKGYHGGFVERLYQGTLLGHVIEHVALELQCLADIGTFYGKTCKVASPGTYNIVYEYKAGEAARKVAYDSFDLVQALLNGKTINVSKIVKNIKKIAEETELGPSTMSIVNAAKRKNIPVTRLNKNSLIQLGYGSKLEIIQATLTGRTSCIAVDIACDKAMTKKKLKNAGLPVPYGKVCTNVADALQFAHHLNEPIVIKPVNGNQGRGVSLSLTDDNTIKQAYSLATQYDDNVLVEKYIQGKHYRCAVVNGKLIAVSWRIPAHVCGDGIHTIAELVELENKNPLRGEYHEKPLTKLRFDPIVKMVLAQQEMTYDSVPLKGKQVLLRENANLSTGGIAYDVTDDIHPDNRLLVENAVKIIGLDVAGVDIVLEDITKSYHNYGGSIIEINAAPGLRMHHFPAKGKARDVAAAIVDYLFPGSNDGRIPIVTVTGTNGKTTTARLITAILSHQYKCVGNINSDGIFINDQCIYRGDATGPQSTLNLLERKEIDVAVLELARGGILRGGLAFDYNDVAVITNIGYDHIGQDGVESQWDLVDIKALTLEALKPSGYAIINADDKFCHELSKSARGNIIYFSLISPNSFLEKHLQTGGRAVCVINEQITLLEGKDKVILLDIAEIPLTFEGAAKHNIANVLAAVATTWGLELSKNKIIQGLISFKPDLEDNPGRQNFINLATGHTIMLDYVHNQAGLQAILDFSKKLNYQKVTIVISAPGDRSNEQIRKMGQQLAQGFDCVIIKEDKDKRGRIDGETAQLLYNGLEANAPNANVRIILDEVSAIKCALETTQINELIIVAFENFHDCLTSIKKACDMLLQETNNKLVAGQ